MRLPKHITFTGLDEKTDLDRVQALSKAYPIEWGVLFSPSKSGHAPRYPSPLNVVRFYGHDIQMAAHLCGNYAMSIMNRGPAGLLLRKGEGGFGRIQVNHVAPVASILKGYQERIGIPVIAQSRLVRSFPSENAIDWLYDCSGGKGVTAEKWPPHPGKPRFVGYAGGIGPENVSEVLQQIGDLDGDFWIDMESRVRTDDWLDLDKVQAVCRAVYG